MGQQTTIGEKAVHRLGFGAIRIVGPGMWGEPEYIAELNGVGVS
jgi:hypothetical protein